MSPPALSGALEVLPIYPDDDAPVREGFKVPLPDGDGYAFFPDTTYGASASAYEAATDWAAPRPVDESDTRNVVRIEIDPREEERTDRKGRKRVVQARRRTYGWQVRMRRQGESHSQFFNDNAFGGSLGALKAAQYWRTLRSETLAPVDPKVAADRSRDTRSQFGVPGLRVLELPAGDGQLGPYLQASWPETTDSGHTRRKRKTLSLTKYDPDDVTVRLCRALVAARGTEALPSTGPTLPALSSHSTAVQAAANAFRHALEADAGFEGDLEAATVTFAEVYDRAVRGVAERLAAGSATGGTA